MSDPIGQSFIFDPLSQAEASFDIYARAEYFPKFVRVYVPIQPLSKLSPAVELNHSIDLISNPGISDKENNLERSLRRSRKNIKDIIFCNDFDLFVTLTIAADRENDARSKSKIINWIKNEKKRKGKFEYLIVPEFHQDQKALHFHSLFLGYQGTAKKSFTAKGRPIFQKGRRAYELPSFTSGFSNVKLIDQDIDSATKVGFYLQKYITKDMPRIFGQNRYWPSNGLKRPTIEYNPESWYKITKADRQYENEYGKILEFDLGNNPIIDMFLEIHSP